MELFSILVLLNIFDEYSMSCRSNKGLLKAATLNIANLRPKIFNASSFLAQHVSCLPSAVLSGRQVGMFCAERREKTTQLGSELFRVICECTSWLMQPSVHILQLCCF